MRWVLEARGHTPDEVLFYLPEHRLLHTADLTLPLLPGASLNTRPAQEAAAGYAAEGGTRIPAWVDRQPAGGVQRSSLPGPSPCTACRGQSREHQPPSSGPSSAIRSQPFPTVALGVIGPAMPGCRVVPSPQVRCHEKRRRLVQHGAGTRTPSPANYW